MIDKTTYRRGNILALNHPKLGRMTVVIEKINPKNLKVKDVSGTVYNCDPHFLEPATSSEKIAFTPPAPASPAPYASTGLFLGQVVKFKGSAIPVHKRGLFVVLGQHGAKYRVAKLGGDKNRYIRGVLPHNVENVDFAVAGV